ncbi:MAG: TIGR00282 family metallophosphoesterase [Candidatus Omnitrophica bacterium]|nr:TIGR00282 family metallophosphoesterase [Candidatus Omnitrophota bacterium]
MKIFCIGDIVGKVGRKAVEMLLPELKKEYQLDFVIANAENAAGGSGITPRMAEHLFRIDCNVLTLGDHVWDREELVPYLEKTPQIIRPANFPPGTPGKGWCIVTSFSGVRVGVINLLGRVFMRYNMECPFRTFERILEEIRDKVDVVVVDFHAETTSEKVAFGHFADGKAAIVVGTHTHIQTADERILPKGTAYITDLGMTGPYDSVIGQNKEKIIQRFLTIRPVRFQVAKEDIRVCGVVVDVDEEKGTARKIERVQKIFIPDEAVKAQLGEE